MPIFEVMQLRHMEMSNLSQVAQPGSRSRSACRRAWASSQCNHPLGYELTPCFPAALSPYTLPLRLPHAGVSLMERVLVSWLELSSGNNIFLRRRLTGMCSERRKGNSTGKNEGRENNSICPALGKEG